MLSADILSIGKTNYLIIVDEVLWFLMLDRIPNRAAKAIAKHLKRFAAIRGIPTVLRADRGHAFSAGCFG